MNSRHCATCRWYLRDGYPDRRYGACKRLSWEQYRVAATHTCGDWEASTPTHTCSTCRLYKAIPDVPGFGASPVCEYYEPQEDAAMTTPGVGCGVGEAQGRPQSDKERRTTASRAYYAAAFAAQASLDWRVRRQEHQAAADAAGVLEGLEGNPRGTPTP